MMLSPSLSTQTANKIPVGHQFKIPIVNEDALKAFVLHAWGVKIPDLQVCEGHSTPWRAFADAYFAVDPVDVWKASRGFGGKSYLLALLGLTEAATLKADVNVLGGSGLQSERVHDYMQQFWSHSGAPRRLLASDPIKRETRLSWGNSITALQASMKSVRGPHPQRLRLDEIDEMDLKILKASQGQTMGKDGISSHTVMSSTHQYADGTMTWALKEANKRGWAVHQWCYKETSANPAGWLDLLEISRKRSEVATSMWESEYDLQEPSPESRAIQPDKVAAMFDRSLGSHLGSNNEYLEIEEPAIKCKDRGCEWEGPGVDPSGIECPECGGKVIRAKYTTGADWAKKQDWTVIITFRTDVSPMRLVAFHRMGRMPWPTMVEQYNKRIRRYRGSSAHDATGIGDVVDAYITSGAGSEPVIMAGRPRQDLLSNYISGIERGEIVSPHIEFMENEHRLASVDDVYGSGHLPDTMAAGALAYSARIQGVYFK